MTTNNPEYNLEDRTLTFGKQILLFCRSIPKDIITTPLISQLVRSGTSIGANYHEANSSSSKKDFKNKIHIAKKEASETKYWVELLAVASPDTREEGRKVRKECQESTLILGKIISSLKNSDIRN